MKQGNDSWDFPHAFYLDAADTDGGIRVGTAENGFGPSEVTCAHVKWTDCTGSQPKCPTDMSEQVRRIISMCTTRTVRNTVFVLCPGMHTIDVVRHLE